jgi:hypothetical protein
MTHRLLIFAATATGLVLSPTALTTRAEAPDSDFRLSLDRWQRHLVEFELPDRAIYIDAADIDGDGNKDLVTGAWWYRNPGTVAGQWSRHTIGEPLNNMAIIRDFDNDGDADVLGTQGTGAAANAKFVWASNDGRGTFTIIKNVPEADGDFLQGVAAARFADGGPLEIALSWHAAQRGVQLFTVPANPKARKWKWRKISNQSLDEDLSVGDIDDDGDLDLFQGTSWLENPGTADSDWPCHVIGQVTIPGSEPDRNDLFDFNGDGRLDAAVGLEKGSDVLLFLAPADPKQPWNRRIIGTDVGGGFSMDSGDMDNDGDVDVVLGEHRGAKVNRVIVFENQNRAETWRAHVIDSGPKDQIDHHDGTVIVDLDGDGDRDVISIGWYNPKVWIFENKAGDD